jgi:predicted phage terminase large subunit-like protein
MNAHVTPNIAAIEVVRRRTIQDSLAEFAIASGYQPAAHHLLLIEELEKLESGETETLLVFMPPGSAKSTYVNFLFPAWYLARNKTHSVLSASHSSELAEKWGRRTRALVSGQSTVLDIALSHDSQAAYRWRIEGGEDSYYAVGVGVGIAGNRVDLGIIDDPFGSRQDAESKLIRERIWDWYSDDFSSRLKPRARRVLMHTRWHDDDLAGRVIRQLDRVGRRYRVLNLPAEAIADDPLGRQPGELLWDDPNGYDYGSFLRARKLESDTRTWASLYQQNPVPDEGDYFKAEWLKSYDELPARSTLRVYGGSDYAVTSDGGDFTVHAVVGIDPDGRMYLLDLWRKQASSDIWVDSWCDLVKKWRPIEWAEEQGQIKSGVGPFLEKVARERKAYCVRTQFPTRGDKAVRAQSIRGRMAMHSLLLPSSAPWRADFEAELLRFPAGVHDDQVDAIGLVGQLLDKMMSGVRERPVEKPRRDRWDREPEETVNWRTV